MIEGNWKVPEDDDEGEGDSFITSLITYLPIVHSHEMKKTERAEGLPWRSSISLVILNPHRAPILHPDGRHKSSAFDADNNCTREKDEDGEEWEVKSPC